VREWEKRRIWCCKRRGRTFASKGHDVVTFGRILRRNTVFSTANGLKVNHSRRHIGAYTGEKEGRAPRLKYPDP